MIWGTFERNQSMRRIWKSISVKKHKTRIARQVIVVWSFAALLRLGVFIIKELDVQPGCPVPSLPLAVCAGRHACEVLDPIELLKAELEKGPWPLGVVDSLMMPHLIQVVEAPHVVDHDYDFQESLGWNQLVVGKGSISLWKFCARRIGLNMFDLDTWGLYTVWLYEQSSKSLWEIPIFGASIAGRINPSHDRRDSGACRLRVLN